MNINSLIKDINYNSRFVKDSLLVNNQEKASAYLQKVTNIIKTIIDSPESIVGLPPKRDNFIKQLVSTQEHLIQLFPPKDGIERKGQNCWANSMIQMLRHSNLAKKYPSICSKFVDSQLFREQLSRFEKGRINPSMKVQTDPAEGFEVLFNKLKFTHSFTQKVKSGKNISITERLEPLFGLEMPIGKKYDFEEMYARTTKAETEHSITREKQTTSLFLKAKNLNTKEPLSDIFIQAKRFNMYKHIANDIESIPNQLPNHLRNYYLTSCIILKGDIKGGGHYVNLIKEGDHWKYINDESVFEWRNDHWVLVEGTGKNERNGLPSPDKLLKQGYIFHYRYIGPAEETPPSLFERIYNFFLGFFFQKKPL